MDVESRALTENDHDVHLFSAEGVILKRVQSDG